VVGHRQSAAELLADAWQHWATRCRALTEDEWSTPTRCPPWDVAALAAHLAPDQAMFDRLAAAAVEGEPAVTDAAVLLARFNVPEGIAHSMADQIADSAVTTASSLSPGELIERFETSATVVRTRPMPATMVLPHPIVGSTTLGVLTDVALMEATVHYLDLCAAVGGEPLPEAILTHTRDLLGRVAEPIAAIEALAGRAPLDTVFPVLR
jgi:uncharacterized protein (TIGR03083 family)